MAGAIALRTDYTAEALRRLASRAWDANVARRLLSLAAVQDGVSRGDAARIGGMNRQTLCGTGCTGSMLWARWPAGSMATRLCLPPDGGPAGGTLGIDHGWPRP